MDITAKELRNVHNLVNYVNRDLPVDEKITYNELMVSYGQNLINRTYNILRDSLNMRNCRTLLEGPKFTHQNNLWLTTYKLNLPDVQMEFYGNGFCKKTSDYDAQLSTIVWLDRIYRNRKQIRKTNSYNLRPLLIQNTVRQLADHNFSPPQKKKAAKNFADHNLRPQPIQKTATNRAVQNLTIVSSYIQQELYCRTVLAGLGLGPAINRNNILQAGFLNTQNALQTRLLSTQNNNNTHPEPPIEVSQKNNQATEDTDFKALSKIFPSPKNVLHNIYSVLSEELKEKSLRITPQYSHMKKTQPQWACSYHLKWPEDIHLTAKANTKQEASHKAALVALSWLKKNGKITDKGQPIIFDKKEIKQLSKTTLPIVSVKKSTMNNMNEIINLYETEMMPLLLETVGDTTKDFNDNTLDGEMKTGNELDDIKISNNRRQRYIKLETYLAKEKTDLPIAKYKEQFMDLLKTNNVIIIKGEPGCGKSTRIPQYVLETWAREDGLAGEPCSIAVTQPRRIAAISLAERVASERNEEVGHIVGYQVRLKSSFRPHTGRVLYCTTGILLRHLQGDQKLSKFTHVILDEAHERDVNTDLLMNLLRTAVKTNPNLKLIVMSATINTEMFQDYFDGAPILDIPGFTYPVKQNFLDNCKLNVEKTLKMCEGESPEVVHEDVAKVIDFIHRKKDEGAILCFLPGWEDIKKVMNLLTDPSMTVFALHSRLQDSDQWKIFSKPPKGQRKVILATNIAETSVTIDDVVYVVDSGIQKEHRFDIEKGVNVVDNHWVSKASAIQRKGRAGRVQPGESFHLYPRSKYESFIDFSLPEILRTSLTKIVLDSKVFSSNMDALEFMSLLPSPPEKEATLKAVEELKDLELVNEVENLTSLGKTVAEFQLEPKLAKAMVNAVVFKCVTPIVDIVTLFSAETELFVSGLINKSESKGVKKDFCDNSDHLAMMRLFEKWLELYEESDEYMVRRFCKETNLIPHKMTTLEKLRKIHFDYLYNGLYDVLPISDDCSDNDELVKAVLFSGVGTVLQHRNWDIVKNKIKNNVNVLITRNNQKATITSDSVNFKRHKYPSKFLLYIQETRSNIRRTTVIRESSLISHIAVLLFSNKNLEIKTVEKENFSKQLNSSDQVVINIVGTKISLLCDRAQAQSIFKCKEALNAGYKYYIQQLTGGEYNEEINTVWNKSLSFLNEILKENQV